MRDNGIYFRAIISPETIIRFTLSSLIDRGLRFSIRELVIPWLRAGNQPDRYTGYNDKNGEWIFEHDDVRYTQYAVYDDMTNRCSFERDKTKPIHSKERVVYESEGAWFRFGIYSFADMEETDEIEVIKHST